MKDIFLDLVTHSFFLRIRLSLMSITNKVGLEIMEEKMLIITTTMRLKAITAACSASSVNAQQLRDHRFQFSLDLMAAICQNVNKI